MQATVRRQSKWQGAAESCVQASRWPTSDATFFRGVSKTEGFTAQATVRSVRRWQCAAGSCWRSRARVSRWQMSGAGAPGWSSKRLAPPWQACSRCPCCPPARHCPAFRLLLCMSSLSTHYIIAGVGLETCGAMARLPKVLCLPSSARHCPGTPFSVTVALQRLNRVL